MAARTALARLALGATLASGAGLVAVGAQGVVGLDTRLEAAQHERVVRDARPAGGGACPHRSHPRPTRPRRTAASRSSGAPRATATPWSAVTGAARRRRAAPGHGRGDLARRRGDDSGRRERDLRDQPAARPRPQGERAAVRLGHGADDREPEPAPGVGAARSRRSNGSARRPSASSGMTGPLLATRSRAEPSAPAPASSSATPPGTLWRTAFSTRFAARRSSSAASPRDRRRGRAARAARPTPRRPRARPAPPRAAGAPARSTASSRRSGPAAAGQHHQPVEQRLGAVGRLEHDLAHLAQLGDGRVGVGQRHVGLGADHGQRAAQLVARVGDEAALGVEGRLEAVEHLVERVAPARAARRAGRPARCARPGAPRRPGARCRTIRRSGLSTRPATSQPSAIASSAVPASASTYWAAAGPRASGPRRRAACGAGGARMSQKLTRQQHDRRAHEQPRVERGQAEADGRAGPHTR